MADRTVVYRLIADSSGFKSGMTEASAATKKTERDLDGATRASGRYSTSLTSAGVSTAGLATAAVGLGTAVVMTAANFDQAMSNVQAATHESAAGMKALREAAVDAGSTTAFSATEAAAGIEALAKAGVSTQDILSGGLAGALDLAAAGSISVGEAAEYTATALTQFQLAGDQATHVADLLAAGAGKAQGEVSDMALALNYVGVPAAQLGVTIEETAGTIALLAKNGVLGEKAGTSMRGMLMSLTAPSKIAKAEMDRLGISVFDASGEFVGFEGVAGQLQSRLGGLSEAERSAALGRIFGNEQIQAANILYRDGADGVAEWTAQVDDSGYAAETAAIKMDNLKGRWEEFTGALEANLIIQGEGTEGPLSALLEGATELLNLTGELQKQSDGALTTLGLGPAIDMGLDNLRRTREAIFGVSDAEDEATEAGKKHADALDVTASATRALSSAVVVSEADLKAQAKALSDSREAANDTARQFFNLGDSLDDAAISLGDWIRDMEDQANALANFRENAKKAAREGLDKGLIRALHEAGPAGALRMRQLANATEGEIDRANKAWRRGQSEVRAYTDAIGGVPEEVKTQLRIEKAAATRDLTALQKQLDSIDRFIPVNIHVSRTGTGGDLPYVSGRKATGGPIFGPGSGTSDDVPIWASNGEHMWTAREVANAGGHAAVEAMRARFRYADGGAISMSGKGKADPWATLLEEFGSFAKAIRSATRAMEDQEAVVDTATVAYDALIARQADLATATSSRFAADLFAVPEQGDPWATSSRTTANPLAALLESIAGLRTRSALQQQLAAAGMSGGALDAVLTQGSNADLMAILQNGQAGRLQGLYDEYSQLTASVGRDAGQLAYGASETAAAAEVSRLTGVVRELKRDLKQYEKWRDARAEQRSDRLAKGINGAAAKGHRGKQQRGHP